MQMLRLRTASTRLGPCKQQVELLRPKRLLHQVVKLPYEKYGPHANGIYPLYSKQAFNIAWTEYQTSLIEQVNRLTKGTKHPITTLNVATAIEHEDLFNIVVLSAKQAEMGPLFNAASSAWNNAFFFFGIVWPILRNN